MQSMSAAEINDRLDQRFRLLTRGSRVALGRQHTLQTTVDWSYQLLDEAERTVLAPFVGVRRRFHPLGRGACRRDRRHRPVRRARPPRLAGASVDAGGRRASTAPPGTDCSRRSGSSAPTGSKRPATAEAARDRASGLVPRVHGRLRRSDSAGSTARPGWHAWTASSTTGAPRSRTRSRRPISTRWPTSSARSRPCALYGTRTGSAFAHGRGRRARRGRRTRPHGDRGAAGAGRDTRSTSAPTTPAPWPQDTARAAWPSATR